MFRLVLACLPAVSLFASSALAQDASLIRVEPRPYYGATITIEEGVRVFRPLPKTKTMVINPGQKTPLHINVGGQERAAHNVTNNVRVNTSIVRRNRPITIPVNPPIR